MVGFNPWYIVTLTGDPRFWLTFTFVLLLIYFMIRKKVSRRNKALIRKGFSLFIVSLWLVAGITWGLKYIVDIQRPCIPCTNEELTCNPYCAEDPSFPSGHTSIAFAIFTSLYLAIREKRLLLFFIIPLLVGFSRINLGVHNPIDVFAGMLIGLIIPIVIFEVYVKIFKK